jgi:hypothetical protein
MTSLKDLDRALRRIVGIVHPDKWSSGQRSPEELAHAVTTELLALRESMRGRHADARRR